MQLVLDFGNDAALLGFLLSEQSFSGIENSDDAERLCEVCKGYVGMIELCLKCIAVGTFYRNGVLLYAEVETTIRMLKSPTDRSVDDILFLFKSVLVMSTCACAGTVYLMKTLMRT